MAIDLPGQGFTRMGSRRRCSVEAMAEDIAALCAAQGWHPHAVIGHSAGGALALQLAQVVPVGRVVGINAALGTFDGAAGWLFALMAKVLALPPMVPELFSRLSGTPERVKTLLASTGSKIDAEGRGLYLRLLRMSGHVDATLLMMAQWKLERLLAGLPALDAQVLLITGRGRDSAACGVATRSTTYRRGRLGRSARLGPSAAGRGGHRAAASHVHLP